MGAIAGLLPGERGFGRDDLTRALTAASDAMRRRAPIEGAMAVARDGTIGLAHRAGRGPGGESVLQPLTNETGRLWLVADGEPSNAAELRLELVSVGHRFLSASGSEVILHLYEDDGVRAFERLAGGFAFALWDPDQRELLIARDRFGEKPLYFADDPQHFRFASEVKALDEGAALARTALAFLTLGYIPEPLCVAPAARAVTPGSVVRVRRERVWSESFWQQAPFHTSAGRDADRARLGCLVREAVQVAVRGEEDVGIFLDGSLASAALLALARPMLGRGLRTHSFVFDGDTPSSRWWRRAPRAGAAGTPESALAAWFGSDHCQHRIGPAQAAAALSAAAAADQPSLGAGLGHVAAACMQSSGDRLVLSPLGAPELLGLPPGAAPPWLWRAAFNGSARAIMSNVGHLAARFRPFGRAAVLGGYLSQPETIASGYLAARALFSPQALARLLKPEALEHARAEIDLVACLEGPAPQPPGPSFAMPARSARAAAVRVLAGIDRVGRLTSGALRDAESAAANKGLALRAPYLDHRLLEWETATGCEDVTAGSALFTEVLGLALPAPLRRGLRLAPSPPLERWMRGGLRSHVEAHLFAEDPDGIFAEQGIAALWGGFLARQVGWPQVWALAVLRAWVAARRASSRAMTSGPVRSPSKRNAA